MYEFFVIKIRFSCKWSLTLNNCKEESNLMAIEKFNKRSLAETHPDLAKQWHPTKNDNLKPHNVTRGSHKKVYWLCPNEHVYQASIKNRTNGSDCPFCSKRLITVERTFKITDPILFKQLHPTKNSSLDLNKLTRYSRDNADWICPFGHEWKEPICNRTGRLNFDCKVCNSIGYLKPELLKEWHEDNSLSLYDASANSNKKIKWKCNSCGHVWVANIANRYRGSKCPGCSGAAVIPSKSIAAQYPEIAKELDDELNTKNAFEISPGSDQIVNWICKNNHKYAQSPYNRIKRNRECYTCKTFAFLCKDLIAEWYDCDLSPYIEFAKSGKNIKWKCTKCQYVWGAKIVDRYYGSGCPYCNVGWTVEKIRLFVASLLPHLDKLTGVERYALCQTGGLFDITASSKGNSFVQAFKTGKFPSGELEKFVNNEPSLVDEFFEDSNNTLESFDSELLGDISEEALLNNNDQDLRVIQTKDALALLDSKIISSADAETIDFLIKSAVAKIWQHTYLDENEAQSQLAHYQGDGEYSKAVKQLYSAEYQGVKDLKIPKGYSFFHTPNLMQRHVAFLIKTRKRSGNWSGTGAGKTLSAILASRDIGAGLTVICCPNNVIDNWKKQINEAFPDSLIYTKESISRLKNFVGKYQYLILNYEFFQQPGARTKLDELIVGCDIRFIIIDEIHFSKQRTPKNASERKKCITEFLSNVSNKNENLCVLGMSATPVINELYEGKTLIELVTGVYHDELETRPTIPNCIALYKKFVTHGVRYIPNYSQQLNQTIEKIDCSAWLPEIRSHTSNLALEVILTKVKLPFILEHLRPKTIIYTHYRDGIEFIIQEAVVQKNWKVAFFNGATKEGLKSFVEGDVDILIASSCIGTGVDGLQKVCNRLIINCLPWTHAEYKQLIGRIYRQGQAKTSVDVIIPLTYAIINGERWSWCESRWKRIEFKKSVADAAVDGVIPEGHLRTVAQAHKDIMQWFERLDHNGINTIERSKIASKFIGYSKQLAIRKIGDITRMNQLINKETSQETHERFSNNHQEFYDYHQAYGQVRTEWEVVPYQEAIKWCNVRSHLVIGDFGCGEAFLAQELTNKVYSFDHVAINEQVTACDMSHVPLDDGILDVAVFSLSLMGINYVDYLREARRCLKLDGHLWVAEPTSRIVDIEHFKELLDRLGFDVRRVHTKWKFIFIEALKSDREVNEVLLVDLLSKKILE